MKLAGPPCDATAPRFSGATANAPFLATSASTASAVAVGLPGEERRENGPDHGHEHRDLDAQLSLTRAWSRTNCRGAKGTSTASRVRRFARGSSWNGPNANPPPTGTAAFYAHLRLSDQRGGAAGPVAEQPQLVLAEEHGHVRRLRANRGTPFGATRGPV